MLPGAFVSVDGYVEDWSLSAEQPQRLYPMAIDKMLTCPEIKDKLGDDGVASSRLAMAGGPPDLRPTVRLASQRCASMT
jgi:hypothetical protein